MTMTAQPFIDAICASPEDDGCRLVYCDFLEEQGDSDRAKFIRRECARVPQAEDDYPKITNWTKTDLVGEYWGADGNTRLWRKGEIRAACGDIPVFNGGATLRRGFVEAVWLSWSDWLQHHAALRTATPLRHVNLTSWPQMHSWFAPGRNGTEHSFDGNRWFVFPVGGGVTEVADAAPQRSGIVTVDMPSYGASLLAGQWPGIAFTLPPPPSTDWDNLPAGTGLVDMAALDAAMEATRPYLEPVGGSVGAGVARSSTAARRALEASQAVLRAVRDVLRGCTHERP